jgi:hypothetical protein
MFDSMWIQREDELHVLMRKVCFELFTVSVLRPFYNRSQRRQDLDAIIDR